MPILARYTAQWPNYGHRRLHRLMLADGHVTSASTVFRALRLLRAQDAVTDAGLRAGEGAGAGAGVAVGAARRPAGPTD